MTHAIDVQGIYDDLSAGKAVHYDPNSRDLRDVFLKYLDGHYIVGPRDGSDEDSGSDLDSIAHDGRLTAQEADEFYRLSTTELPWLNFSITQIAGEDMQLTKDELVRVAAERVGELGVSNHLYDKLRAEEPEFYEYARQLLIDELNLVNQAEIPVTHSVSQP